MPSRGKSNGGTGEVRDFEATCLPTCRSSWKNLRGCGFSGTGLPQGMSRQKKPLDEIGKKGRRAGAVAHSPHDGLFRFALGNVEQARSALSVMLPPQVLKHVDLSTLALDNGHFVNPDLEHSETDLLFNVQIAARPGKIFILFEHMSHSDHFMVLRLLGYVQDIWKHEMTENPGLKKLPVIIPLVLHHSPAGWTSSVRLEELLDLDQESLAGLLEVVPRFGMVLHDISRVDDEELMGQAMTALVRLTLLLFRHGQSARDAQEICGRLGKCATVVQEVFAAPNGASAIAAVMRYIQSMTKQSFDEVRMAMQQNEVLLIDEETYWDIRSPGWREERGLKRGLEQGREQERRALVSKQLAVRFGQLPPWVDVRLQQATMSELEQMTISVLDARTLEEVVGVKSKVSRAKRGTRAT